MKKSTCLGLVMVAALALSSVVSSAQVTVTKRKHTRGFHIELFSKRNNNKVATENNTATVVNTVKPEVSTEVVLPAVESPSLTFSETTTASVSVKPVVKNVVAKKMAKQHAKMAKLIAKKQATVKAEKTNKVVKKAMHTSRRGGIDVTAALLCFFLGSLGVHRFYLGYTWQGVVQLLTLGGCGIWALIDFIRILMGDLTEK